MNTNETKKIKLTLDSSALDRLLGGDTELELELRQSIACQFAKRHLKPLINCSEIAQIAHDIKGQAVKHATDLITDTVATIKTDWGSKVINLKPEVINTIRSKVREEINTIVSDAVGDAISEVIKEIPQIVTNRVNVNVTAEVKRQVDAKMAAMRASLD